jgi:4,5-dihydroxyphthalate decarboxylase
MINSGQTNPGAKSRRAFLSATAMAGSAVLAGRALNVAQAGDKPLPLSGKVRITLAGYPYDRVKGLMDGRVEIERCQATFEIGRIGEMNSHVFSGPQSREVSEVGLLPFILAYANEDFRDYTLIPVFPLRVFRHKSIFIRTDRGIREPIDLRGKRIAVPAYSSTSLTWIRGILQHEYGVLPNQIKWVLASKESSAEASGGASKLENVLPEGISIRSGPQGKDESQLLVDGDVDGVFHAAEPKAFQDGHPKVARLFSDSRTVEQEYFAKTGIFPIMHAVAVRKDLVETHPWITEAVFDAYSRAKQLAYDEIIQNAWYLSALPWIAQEAEATRQLMGDNYYSYGIQANRKTLETLLQYAHEQGLARRRPRIEELFHASTMKLSESAHSPNS